MFLKIKENKAIKISFKSGNEMPGTFRSHASDSTSDNGLLNAVSV